MAAWFALSNEIKQIILDYIFYHIRIKFEPRHAATRSTRSSKAAKNDSEVHMKHDQINSLLLVSKKFLTYSEIEAALLHNPVVSLTSGRDLTSILIRYPLARSTIKELSFNVQHMKAVQDTIPSDKVLGSMEKLKMISLVNLPPESLLTAQIVLPMTIKAAFQACSASSTDTAVSVANAIMAEQALTDNPWDSARLAYVIRILTSQFRRKQSKLSEILVGHIIQQGYKFQRILGRLSQKTLSNAGTNGLKLKLYFEVCFLDHNGIYGGICRKVSRTSSVYCPPNKVTAAGGAQSELVRRADA